MSCTKHVKRLMAVLVFLLKCFISNALATAEIKLCIYFSFISIVRPVSETQISFLLNRLTVQDGRKREQAYK